MDRYLVPLEPSSSNPKPIPRSRWKRAAIELNGRIGSNYRHEMYSLLFQSYSQIGVFPHVYQIDQIPCPTHLYRILGPIHPALDYEGSSRRYGISDMDFDNQGIYLASVSKAGCLTLHDFESLYVQSTAVSPWLEENERSRLLHIPTHSYACQLDAVRWNPANQDEVACTSLKSSEIYIFDVAYTSSEPTEVLRKRPAVTIHGSDIPKGLSDLAFTPSRIFACDTYGSINVWDRRRSAFPSMELTTNSHIALNSMQLDGENHIVYGAGKQGIIYMWDLRGGRTSAAFQSHKEAYHPPLTSVKLSSLLDKIEPLKAQSGIVPQDIHSISLDPSSASRLAFHLDVGWSGILDINDLHVTHIHCPPPAWLTRPSMFSNSSYVRKPSWFSINSVYAVGSSSDNKGLNLLDFYPDVTSPCHVDYREDTMNTSKRNGFVPLSEDVTACAAHPLNDFIVVGTEEATLVVIGQQKRSWVGEEGLGNNESVIRDIQSS